MSGPKPRDITYEVNENGCHICTSHRRKNGYTQILINGKRIYLHRFIYEKKFGPIKGFNVIRHRCDNPFCINPDHLIEGTQTDNVKDMVDRNRNVKGITQGSSKLTEEQVLDIFNNHTDSNVELGRKYNVDNSTIWYIRKGKTWKHITR